MSRGRRNPRARTGRPLHTAWELTQPEEGQAESMSVSIETIADQGRALGYTGTWGLETSLLPAPGPGMGVKAPTQTCAQEVMAGFGAQSKHRGAQLLKGVGRVLTKLGGETGR